MRTIVDQLSVASYVEPFAGGAAVFFAFEWPRATLNDLNAHLVAAYRGIRADPEAVKRRLRSMKVSPQEFERVRTLRPRTDVGHAVRLLYLNRSSYGGIYRTDRHGSYNVPFSGDRPLQTLWKDRRLERVSAALASAKITCEDFETSIGSAGEGAFVYCDPAYALPGGETNFRRYGAPAFNWKDQERLSEAVREAVSRGAVVAVSNIADARVEKLYPRSVTFNFKRRSPLPTAGGQSFVEALHVLGDAALRSALVKAAAGVAH